MVYLVQVANCIRQPGFLLFPLHSSLWRRGGNSKEATSLVVLDNYQTKPCNQGNHSVVKTTNLLWYLSCSAYLIMYLVKKKLKMVDSQYFRVPVKIKQFELGEILPLEKFPTVQYHMIPPSLSPSLPVTLPPSHTGGSLPSLPH